MKQSPVLLSIIIVSYNTRELLEQCINSIVKSREINSPSARETKKFARLRSRNWEIIVVDNNSADGTREYLSNIALEQYGDIDKKRKQSKRLNVYKANANERSIPLKVIFNNQNLGFAKANNIGIKESRGKYLLFLNPDTIVLPETLPFMLEFMKKNPAVGVATCRVELVDGKLDEACHRGFPTPWNAFCHFSGLEKLFPHSQLFAGYYLGYLDLNTTHEIDSGVGAFMLVPRLVGEKIGWWDEDYFWYGEDIDFCYRVKKAGFKVMFVPKVKIIHYKGASSGIKKTKSKADFKTREKAMLASTQAMRIFYQKHYRGKYPKPIGKLVFWGINLLEKARVGKIKREA